MNALSKCVFLFLVAFFNLTAISAQVSGISGSKIGAFTVDPVDHKDIEFEPLFFHFQSSQYWNDEGDLEQLAVNGDSIKWITGLNYRISYGIDNKLELGASYSNDLLLATLGAKYVLINNAKYGLAVIGGINFPMGNKTISKSIRFANTIVKSGGGLVYSRYFNSNFSLDANIQYYRFLKRTTDLGKDNIYFNADIGHYFDEKQIQAIIGIRYQESRYEAFTTKVFTIHPGVTIETGRNFIIVANGTFDLKGKNAFKNTGVALALTITIN